MNNRTYKVQLKNFSDDCPCSSCRNYIILYRPFDCERIDTCPKSALNSVYTDCSLFNQCYFYEKTETPMKYEPKKFLENVSNIIKKATK